ncbi:JmjC-domain-containing protein [Meira miltonrushii]|uniref:[histone H3]-trimethyl-L-lysine(9) demethylase n=1 Tax=Meira miltonrushii TaxID=1280837 RepID=A0A316VBK1_9BASI|nr:JmjC-domain-containing protein [Meira miltonrushii]PWN34488.1 JmjC-domain-containing protein [Meira miltonrushii]
MISIEQSLTQPMATAIKQKHTFTPELSHDHDSLTSRSDHYDRIQDAGNFAEAFYGSALPPSPPSSAHSSTLAETQQRQQSEDIKPDTTKLSPLRPAYLYLEGEDAEVPEHPTDDIKGVPVFTPTWEEFKDFYSYCSRIDAWGMRSGIVKIIPPKEWTGSLPSLDGRQNGESSKQAGERYTEQNRLSQVRIKNSIEQIFTCAGAGVWRQSNVVHPGRIVNPKQWADICAQENLRGPEMARMKEVARRKQDDADEDGVRTRSGRGRGAGKSQSGPVPSKRKSTRVETGEQAYESVDTELTTASQETRSSPRKSSSISAHSSSPAKTLSSITNKTKMADRTTQEEWDLFDHINGWAKEAGQDAVPQDWAMDVCRAIEKEYWRGLNYGKPPMYGADLSGTLFTDETKDWNIGKLDNILTRLRLKRKLPGVTTPYLYFGMWRATFAWHVEDMDLYSINYIHFGAPKQWYSIRQADKQRFELAMASAFPADSSRCRHFMRHKSFLASPGFIESAAGRIKPLRLVQKAQEIVLTYPYGYHSGYNLGFNCAESVNFALERWLDIGRKATYCECTDDTVKMDVDAMLDESKEMEELDRKRKEREQKRFEEAGSTQTDEEKAEARKARERERRKRRKEEQDRLAALGLAPDDEPEEEDEEVHQAKKQKIDSFPCEFCPSTSKEDLIVIPSSKSKDDKVKRAHRLCASFLPETWIAPNSKPVKGIPRTPKEVVMGYEGIPKARWSLKCQNCKENQLSKRGAKVQCTYGRCSRTSHVSCALQEGSGWMLDVLPESEADEVEGRTKAAPSKSTKGGKSKKAAKADSNKEDDEEVEQVITGQSSSSTVEEEDDDKDPRMVMLCKVHNPYEREREMGYKVDILRVCLQTLMPSQKICVRTHTGLWETMLQRYERPSEDDKHKFDEGDVILADGSRVKGAKVVFDSETMRLAEDVVWYRDEADYMREKGQLKSAESMVEESKRSKIELQKYMHTLYQGLQSIVKEAVKPADRDRRAAEIERKRREHEQQQQQQQGQQQQQTQLPIPSLSVENFDRARTPVVPSQPEGEPHVQITDPDTIAGTDRLLLAAQLDVSRGGA